MNDVVLRRPLTFLIYNTIFLSAHNESMLRPKELFTVLLYLIDLAILPTDLKLQDKGMQGVCDSHKPEEVTTCETVEPINI